MAMRFPESLGELEERFAADTACLDFLAKLRWENGFTCPACGKTEAWTTEHGKRHCRGCGRQTSATAGTMFDRTRKPLRLWFRAMWHIASQEGGASASDLKRLLGLNSYQTAWAWLHRLRRAMVRPGRYRLTGPVHFDVVEIAWSGEERGSGGRGVWVAVAAQARDSGDGSGRVRLAVVPEGWREYVAVFVERMVAPGNTVIAPAWPWSNVLWHPDYTKRLRTGEECWLPDLIAGRLGPWLLKTYRGGVGIAHLGYYLDEFAFRYTNEGRSPGCLWGQLVQNALMVKPVRRDHLKAPSRRQIDGR